MKGGMGRSCLLFVGVWVRMAVANGVHHANGGSFNVNIMVRSWWESVHSLHSFGKERSSLNRGS